MKTVLKAGFAFKTITPPQGISLAGYFNRRPNTGVLDDLKARAAVFDDGSGGLAGIVALDLISIYKDLVGRVEELLRESGSPLQGRLIICATHTHTGPDLRDKPEAVSLDVYCETLARRIVDCVLAAAANLRPALVKAATGSENPLAFIRRYRMRSGGVITNPGKLNPDILGPESELDQTVSALSFHSPGEATPFGVIANICNHTDTISGTLVSADWPGALERGLWTRYKADPVVMTLIGASGDVNHFDVSSSKGQTSPEEAERVGSAYAGIIHKLLSGAKKVKPLPLSFLAAEAEAFKRNISQKELQDAESVMAKDVSAFKGDFTSEELARGEGSVLRFFASELLAFAKSEAGAKVALPVRLLRLGSALAIVSLPGEPFNAIGTTVRALSKAKFTLVASNAMDDFGYIPLKECFARGGYEILPVSPGGMAPDTADRLIAAAASLLKK